MNATMKLHQNYINADIELEINHFKMPLILFAFDMYLEILKMPSESYKILEFSQI